MTRDAAEAEALAAIVILNNLEAFSSDDRDLILDGIEVWLARVLADGPGPPGKRRRGGLKLEVVESAAAALRKAA